MCLVFYRLRVSDTLCDPALMCKSKQINDVTWVLRRIISPIIWMFVQSLFSKTTEKTSKLYFIRPLCGEFALIGGFLHNMPVACDVIMDTHKLQQIVIDSASNNSGCNWYGVIL